MGIEYHSWSQLGLPHSRPHTNGVPYFMLDYYQRPFLLLHGENARICPDFQSPHPIRKRFWQLVTPGEYAQNEGRVLLQSYLDAVEANLAKSIQESSLAYYIHLYRRLSPGPIGTDQQPHTIGITRAVLEAAIQKYARFGLCNKIAESTSVPIDKVLGGLLMAPDFELERNIVAQGNQLILTDFTGVDLREFYDLERLAFEVWRTAAALRTVGKGAPLIVCDPPECYADARSLDLDTLLMNYDKRIEKSDVCHSATGVTFVDSQEMSASGIVFLPTYNLGGVTSTEMAGLFDNVFRTRLEDEITFNFVWVPFNLREFRKAHLPLANAFEKQHGVSLDAVLAVVGALSFRVFYSWMETQGRSLFRYWQRAYEGPIHRKSIHSEIMCFLPAAAEILEVEGATITSPQVENAMKFWELDASNCTDIDLAYSGPHYMFLPINNDQVFVDYAWILRRLHDLFVGTWISDQNFKGDALEKVVRKDKSVLPTKPCKTASGEKRQIDYAVARGTHLVIAECKAVAQSIAFDRGDPRAIQYRTENVVERALSEVDDKAKWLATHQVGTNYDISAYDRILPVAISPFVEFIPSLQPRYWISQEIARVLTPKELDNLLDDERTIMNAFNRISLH